MKITKVLQLPLVRNTLKLSSSSALLMLLPLIVTPILSRLYTPADYGDWGVFSSVFYVINSFLFLSYTFAIRPARRFWAGRLCRPWMDDISSRRDAIIGVRKFLPTPDTSTMVSPKHILPALKSMAQGGWIRMNIMPEVERRTCHA